jgi:hypothetical protein
MSGLLGTKAGLNSDLNLLLQIIILVILLVGFKFGKSKTVKSLKTHGRIMELVVLLNAASILLVMGPVFVTAFEAVLSEISTGFPLTMVHHLLGLIAEILGIVFVFRKPRNVRLWMRVTFVVWLIALAFGLAFYAVYYVI